jgi:hypothetical protein
MNLHKEHSTGAPTMTAVCDICKLDCRNAGSLAVHKKTHKRIYDPSLHRCHAGGCQYRGYKAFHREENLLQHIQETHPGLPPVQWEKCGRDGCPEEYSQFQMRAFDGHKSFYHREFRRAKNEKTTQSIAAPKEDGDEMLGGTMVQQEEDENAYRDEQQGITTPSLATRIVRPPLNARKDTPVEALDTGLFLDSNDQLPDWTDAEWETELDEFLPPIEATADATSQDTLVTQDAPVDERMRIKAREDECQQTVDRVTLETGHMGGVP